MNIGDEVRVSPKGQRNWPRTKGLPKDYRAVIVARYESYFGRYPRFVVKFDKEYGWMHQGSVVINGRYTTSSDREDCYNLHEDELELVTKEMVELEDLL
jgi:hypothetical protein